MRIYSSEEQHFIKSILMNRDGMRVGRELVANLFDNDSIALAILDDSRVCMLSASLESVKAKTAKLRLFSIIALMESLENEQMICCIDSDPEMSLYMSSEDTSLAIAHDKYTFAEGTIEQSHGNYILRDLKGNIVMNGRVLSLPLERKINHFIVGDVYATSRLKELVENEFKSVEILQYEEELGYTRKSLYVSWAAFIISLLSTILNVPISNMWGKSTIMETQYQGIMQSISSINKSENTKKCVVGSVEKKPVDTLCVQHNKKENRITTNVKSK